MQRDLFLRAPITAFVVALVVLPASVTAVAAADMGATTTLASSVAAVTANKPGVGAVIGTERKTIEVWMAGDQRAAERYARAVSTPGSPSFRRRVSPSAYTERFGPSASQVQAVQSYLTGTRFSAVSASVNDDYVSATATAPGVGVGVGDQALHRPGFDQQRRSCGHRSERLRLLAEHLSNAQLRIYPDAGHGFLNQYPELFADDVHASLER